MKLVHITLLATCMIAGLPRSPVEGVQTVPEDEAKRLVDAKMAEFAEVEGEEADDDGLDKLGITKLRVLAKDEGVTVPEFTKENEKELTVAAIRAKRDAPNDQLDTLSPEKLRETAKAEGVEFADDATDDVIIAAITSKRGETAS